MSSSFVTTQLNSSPQLGSNLEEDEVADDVVTRVMGIPEDKPQDEFVDGQNPSTGSKVMREKLILSTILSYLYEGELKNARLVTSLWKALSEIHFKQRAKIDLISNNRKLYKVELEQFLEICKSHQNFRLNLFFPYHEETLNYENRKILHFVASFAPLIKFLQLSLTVYDSNDFKLKLNVLNNFSNLKELRLDVYLKTFREVFDVEDIFQAVPQLHFVTKLRMIWVFGRDLFEENEPKLQKLSQKLLSMTPNLEEVTLEAEGKWTFASVYLREIVQLQKEWKDSKSKGPMPFQKLTFIKGLCLYDLYASETILMSYLEFLQPLKGLEITYPRADNELTLQKILRKNSTTLETLVIKTDKHFNIALPFLPKLTRLSFRNRDVFNLRELFMMGAKEFTSKFPRLHSIELYFPKDFLPSPNCQLDLSFPQFALFKIGWREKSDWDYDDGNVSNKKWGEWFSKLFPNVHNPWINKFRQNLQENM